MVTTYIVFPVVVPTNLQTLMDIIDILFCKLESTSFNLPQFSQISSIQKSRNFVESHSSNSVDTNRNFISDLKYQHRMNKQFSEPVAVNFDGAIRNGKETDSQSQSVTITNQTSSFDDNAVKITVDPVQSVQRSITVVEQDGTDTNHEEKTVTIKRKITRRKKGSEKINTLRDSYIERIASNAPEFEMASDSDGSQIDVPTRQPNIDVTEIIPLKQSIVNERPPTIFVTSPQEATHETIVPQKKKAAESGALLAFLNKSPDRNSPINEYRTQPNWDYREINMPRIQQRQYRSNHHLPDNISRETYITENQSAPVSSYSARTENMKWQKMQDERNLESRTLQSEGNMGRRNETTEEIETITLQPIGRGVQDLMSSQIATLSRPASRAATPKLADGGATMLRGNFYREENKQNLGYNTVPVMPKFSKTYSIRNNNERTHYDLTDSYKHNGSVQHLVNEQSYIPSLSRASNDQSNVLRQQIPVNRVANEQTFQSSNQQASNALFSGAAAGQNLGSFSCGRGNEQTINTSWHSRTESFTGGNRAYTTPMSHVSNQRVIVNNMATTSGNSGHDFNLQMVINSEEQWYQPQLSRDDVINALRDKEPGSFYIRNSSTYARAYGLAMKVISLPDNVARTNDSKGDLVRHFLIDTVDDGSVSGIRLQGFANESVYSSLAHFVYAHCQDAIALPTRLLLPSTHVTGHDQVDSQTALLGSQYESHDMAQRVGVSSQYQIQRGEQQNASTRDTRLLSQSNSKYDSFHGRQQTVVSKAPLLSQSHRSLSTPISRVDFTSSNHPNPLHQYFKTDAMYLGKVEIDRLKNDNAIEHAIDKMLKKSSLKTTIVEIQLDSTKGVTLMDKNQKMFTIKRMPAQHVLYADFDPKQREFSSPMLQNSGINRGKIMGIVFRKQNILIKENAVHLFCEIDNSQNIEDVITYIKEIYGRT